MSIPLTPRPFELPPECPPNAQPIDFFASEQSWLWSSCHRQPCRLALLWPPLPSPDTWLSRRLSRFGFLSFSSISFNSFTIFSSSARKIWSSSMAIFLDLSKRSRHPLPFGIHRRLSGRPLPQLLGIEKLLRKRNTNGEEVAVFDHCRLVGLVADLKRVPPEK